MQSNLIKTAGLVLFTLAFLTCSKSSEKQNQQAQMTNEGRDLKDKSVQQQVSTTPHMVQQQTSSQSRSVVIYDEEPSKGVRYWIPSGWMPDGQGIAFADGFQGDTTVKPHSGKTCIKFGFDATQKNWVGIYWLAGGSWGDNPGPNIFQLLKIHQVDSVQLRLFACGRDGGERVQFKVAGVNKGRFPDSEQFPISTEYLELTKNWKKYTLDLTGRDLTNLVGGFCVVLDIQNNPNKKQVWFYLDDIVIETY